MDLHRGGISGVNRNSISIHSYLPNSILIRYISFWYYMYVCFSSYDLKKIRRRDGICVYGTIHYYYYIKCTSIVCVYYAMLNSIYDNDDDVDDDDDELNN